MRVMLAAHLTKYMAQFIILEWEKSYSFKKKEFHLLRMFVSGQKIYITSKFEKYSVILSVNFLKICQI